MRRHLLQAEAAAGGRMLYYAEFCGLSGELNTELIIIDAQVSFPPEGRRVVRCRRMGSAMLSVGIDIVPLFTRYCSVKNYIHWGCS